MRGKRGGFEDRRPDNISLSAKRAIYLHIAYCITGSMQCNYNL